MKCMPVEWRRACVSISLDVRDARHNPQRTLVIVYQETTQDESRSDFIILEHGSERGRFNSVEESCRFNFPQRIKGKIDDFLAQEMVFDDNKMPPSVNRALNDESTFLCRDVSPLSTSRSFRYGEIIATIGYRIFIEFETLIGL